ncbi:MAG: hypothetical protein J4432_05210 [DPANN group archaeon]|nr:hypothetical protein [DPANN group archaeon]
MANINDELNSIQDINGDSISQLGILKSIELNEENKHVFVVLDFSHCKHLQSFVEERVHDICSENGYKAYLEISTT